MNISERISSSEIFTAFGTLEYKKEMRQYQDTETDDDLITSRGIPCEGRYLSHKALYTMNQQDENQVLRKLRLQDEDRKWLDELKAKDPGKYQKVMYERELTSCRSIERACEIAAKYGKPDLTLNGVVIQVDDEKKRLSVGDVSQEQIDAKKVIRTGKLSCGYELEFNEDNVDEIQKILPYFTPKDINQILRAISQHQFLKKKAYQLKFQEDETLREVFEQIQERAYNKKSDRIQWSGI